MEEKPIHHVLACSLIAVLVTSIIYLLVNFILYSFNVDYYLNLKQSLSLSFLFIAIKLFLQIKL